MGILCVRGCEVEGMLDEEGKVIEDGKDGLIYNDMTFLPLIHPVENCNFLIISVMEKD